MYGMTRIIQSPLINPLNRNAYEITPESFYPNKDGKVLQHLPISPILPSQSADKSVNFKLNSKFVQIYEEYFVSGSYCRI